MKRLFTSESVTEGHPDKVCDQISDNILDAILQKDPMARVACETAVTTGMVLVMGEITTSCYVDIKNIVRSTIERIGYNNPDYGFDSKSCAVLVALDEQSPDIAQGVDDALETRDVEKNDIGAGDQGMMVGYACNETDAFMPLPISLAHKLSKQLSMVRKDGIIPYLRPDGKTQVTIEYEIDKPVRVHTIVVSTQHDENIKLEQIRADIIKYVIEPIVPVKLIDSNTIIYVNPTGRFVIGGPVGDSGLTGRKIIVDTYGGYASHGGGAFSGKDATKVDRSGAYAARYVAKNIVASGIADRCEIEIAYAIGVAAPVSLHINTYGTGSIEDEAIVKLIDDIFDLRPMVIIEKFGLRNPIFAETAAYGHFGREDIQCPWERLDMVDAIKMKAAEYK